MQGEERTQEEAETLIEEGREGAKAEGEAAGPAVVLLLW